MSVTAAQGFSAAGVTAGLKASGRADVALVVNTGPRDAVAAVYTSNRCKANPVLWSEQVTADGTALVFAETQGRRLSKYWLAGPRAGTVTPLAVNLPGMPEEV